MEALPVDVAGVTLLDRALRPLRNGVDRSWAISHSPADRPAKTPARILKFIDNIPDRLGVDFQRHSAKIDEPGVGQYLFQHRPRHRLNRRRVSVNPFRQPLRQITQTRGFMTIQARDMDFDDPFHGKLIQESFDELFKRHSPRGSRVAVDRPEMPDVEN